MLLKKSLSVLFAILLLGAGVSRQAPAAAASKAVLVEAEAFQNLGGWGLDQQSMDQMGSPYLLAHGLGTPVQDAVTEVKIEQAGSYKLWVRTMDWVARWNAPGAPGKFQVLINGKAAPATFGTEGAKWHWQEGGTVELPAGALKLALHDLTGFAGRCDAILFSADPSFIPPNDLKAMAAWRRQTLGIPEKPAEAGSYDLVVVGGGIAGMCAAINAARLGLQVALIQDRPVLGGNASSEVMVVVEGGSNLPPYPRLGDVVKELETKREVRTSVDNAWRSREDARRLALVRSNKNIRLFLETRVNGAEVASGRIQAVRAQHIRSGRGIRLAGRLFADCTGDGELGALAGADFEVSMTDHMGSSNLWNPIDTGKPAPFPRCPWALDLADKLFPGRGAEVGQYETPGLASLGRWNWESGFAWDPVTQVEDMRDWNFRAMYGAWDTLKNVDGLYPTHKLGWAAYIAGKRESRRLLGDVVLTVEDFKTGRKFDDGCYPCTWGIDIHTPHPRYCVGFEGKAFISVASNGSYRRPYWAPYRTLYSRNIGNLFMAGRDISVTHEALGPVRVMRTCGMMGEVVGMAAALCVKHGVLPRGVYEKHLSELKEWMGSGVKDRG